MAERLYLKGCQSVPISETQVPTVSAIFWDDLAGIEVISFVKPSRHSILTVC